MNISFKLNSKSNSIDEHYVRCIITANKTLFEFRTGVKCKKEKWQAVCKTYTIKGNPSATNELKEIQSNIILEKNIFEKNKIQFTAKMLYEAWQASYQKIEIIKNCIDVFNEFATEYEQKYKVNLITFDSYRRILSYGNILQNFTLSIKKENLLINEIVRGHFEKIKLFCLNERKFGINHTSKILACYKGFLDWAVDNDYLLKNPFSNLSLKKEKTTKIYLSVLELEKIENKIFEIDRLEKIKDLFLFACYSGLAFCDLAAITKENIKVVGGRECIMIDRQKTKNECFLPLLSKAKAILEKYNYVLPVLTNQKYNAYLKEIQTICNINKKLTTHVARKTFINIMINVHNVPVESVALMVGHSSTKTTFEYYANIEHNKILNDTKSII
ncbi:MAG: hypothetical protein EAZ44_08785 [Cytophagia bacterium]|nr:MAG: hypothetical protein EAZ44_08785 [Cytophagia bacterium]TAG38771.1 MAG: hypothetical protein EAZ31_10060 [Cytophagia bacterium]